MEERVSFVSDGLKLAGVLHVPDTRGARERRPAFLVLHGFGSSKDSGGSVASARLFAELGYGALRFDMRGCGQSEGVRGPLLLLHPANDSVTPTEQSIDLFRHAGQPTDLHLVAGVDHFVLSEGNTLVITLLRNWLDKYFPVSSPSR